MKIINVVHPDGYTSRETFAHGHAVGDRFFDPDLAKVWEVMKVDDDYEWVQPHPDAKELLAELFKRFDFLRF